MKVKGHKKSTANHIELREPHGGLASIGSSSIIFDYQRPHSTNIPSLYFHTVHSSCDKLRRQKWMFIKNANSYEATAADVRAT